MTQPFPLAAVSAPAVARPARGEGRWAAGLAIFLVLVFSQGWMMLVAGPNGDPDASSVIRNAYFPAYAATLALLALRPGASAAAAVRMPVLWLLVGIAFASQLWSVAPDLTQRRAIALTFTTLAGLAVAARFDWEALSEILAFSFLVLGLASLGLGLLLPSWGQMLDIFPGAWRGVWQEKNGLGDFMAIGALILIAAAVLNPRRRRLWAAGAGLAVLLLLLSTSKTSVVTFIAGGAALVFVGVVRRGPATAVVASFLALVGLMGLGCALVFDSDLFFKALGKDATLTGRTELWAGVIHEAQKQPLLGYGYGAVWDDPDLWSPLAWITKIAKFKAHHAHNAWLEQWLGMGWVGFWTWAALFAETWAKTLWAVFRSRGAYLALPFLVAFSLISLTESVAVTYNHFIWMIFVALATRLALPKGVALGPASPAGADLRTAPSP